LTFASSTILILLLSDGIKRVSAITVAGTVLDFPAAKNVSKIAGNLH